MIGVAPITAIRTQRAIERWLKEAEKGTNMPTETKITPHKAASETRLQIRRMIAGRAMDTKSAEVKAELSRLDNNIRKMPLAYRKCKGGLS